MSESVFVRVRRVMSGRIEDAVDGLEAAGGESVMREAIREVDRAIDAVRLDQENAIARRLQAQRQHERLVEHGKELGEKARFAVQQGRDDLAEAALVRQSECEAQVTQLDKISEQTSELEGKLAESLAQLRTRKAQMESALNEFTLSQTESGVGGDGPAHAPRNVERQVDQAEAAFDRAMTGAGGVAGASVDKAAAAGVAELDTLLKGQSVAQKLAALKAEVAGATKAA